MKIYNKKNFLNHGIWLAYPNPPEPALRKKNGIILVLIFLIPFLLESITLLKRTTTATIIAAHEVRTSKREFYAPVLEIVLKDKTYIYPMQASEYYLNFKSYDIGDKVKVFYALHHSGEIKSITIASIPLIYPVSGMIFMMYLASFGLLFAFRYVWKDRHLLKARRLNNYMKKINKYGSSVTAQVQKLHVLHEGEVNGILYKEVYLDVFYFDQEKWRQYDIQTYRFYVTDTFELNHRKIDLYIDPKKPQNFILDIEHFIDVNSNGLKEGNVV